MVSEEGIVNYTARGKGEQKVCFSRRGTGDNIKTKKSEMSNENVGSSSFM